MLSTAMVNFRNIFLNFWLRLYLHPTLQLIWFLDDNDIFSQSQHGFRKALSKPMALTDLQWKMYEAFATGNPLSSIFFGMEKAIDKVWRTFTHNSIKISSHNITKFPEKPLLPSGPNRRILLYSPQTQHGRTTELDTQYEIISSSNKRHRF